MAMKTNNVEGREKLLNWFLRRSGVSYSRRVYCHRVTIGGSDFVLRIFDSRKGRDFIKRIFIIVGSVRALARVRRIYDDLGFMPFFFFCLIVFIL